MTRRRATVFGEVADIYDRRRPSYPAAAVDHVLSHVPDPQTVVDIGCGTGKAAALFAARGLDVVGVEPSPEMAAVARARGLRVEVAAFEDWLGPPAHVDVVVSAQAWHWVDHAVGIPKVADMLRPGGAFAILSNTPGDEAFDLVEPVREAYRRVAPELWDTSVLSRWSGDIAGQRDELAASGRFDVQEEWAHDWDEAHSAASFGELMQTHSDHRLLPPEQLRRLVEAVRDAVDANGGVIRVHYRTRVTAALRR